MAGATGLGSRSTRGVAIDGSGLTKTLLLGWVLASGCGGGTNASSPADSTGGSSTVTTGGSSNGSTGGSPNASTGGETSTGGTQGGSGGSSGGRDYGAEREEFFGDSRCEGAGLLLCDGFEGGTIDSALWVVDKSASNVVELTTEHAARGSQSVHIRAANGWGFLKNTSVFPVPNNDYYGRMFLRVARYSTVAWAHWTIGEATGVGDGSKIRIGGQYDTSIGKNRWGVGTDGGPTGDWTTRTQDPNGMPEEPPVNEWTCVEWLHKGSTNETRFYVDGVEHPSLYTTATQHGGADKTKTYELPMMNTLVLGWQQYQSDPVAFDVWIDEVALDSERIGCKL